MKIVIFGLGYSATFIAADQIGRGAQISATVRTAEKAARLTRTNQSVRVFSSDFADPQIAADIADCDALLVSVPPDEAGDPVLTAFSAAIAAAPRLRWIGYLSTIGVYGDHGGGWIDEATPATPGERRSQHRARAEQAWLALGETGVPVHLFRIAGIYGPGRNQLVQLAQGTARRIVKPGQVFNRIHVADIAQIVDASLRRPRAGAIYNLADNEPAPAQDVVAYAAALLGLTPPPEIPLDEAALGPMARSFYNENKRAGNRLLGSELGVTLQYPTYREGLAALVAAGEGRPIG
jgi:nucleoside-diphosphate-sugar epimerase